MAQTYRGENNPVEREIGRAGMQPGMSANELLDDDHNRVLQMFNEYENAGTNASAEEKRRLARAICRELEIHTRIEEEIYYPLLRSRSNAEDLVDDAFDDHARMKELIKNVEGASTHSEALDRDIKALGDEVRDHIHEERERLFGIAEIADCNTARMARELIARKKELIEERH